MIYRIRIPDTFSASGERKRREFLSKRTHVAAWKQKSEKNWDSGQTDGDIKH